QVLGFDDVEEGLEQSAVGGVEDRGDGDETVGVAEVLEHTAQFTGGHTGGHGVHDVVGQFAQFHHTGLYLLTVLGESLFGGLGQAVGQQPGRGRGAHPRADRDEVACAHSCSFCFPVAFLAATRKAWVGASGTWAGFLAANSLRSTGTTSSPRMSSCSNTVLSGRPAWSIRNSWRW